MDYDDFKEGCSVIKDYVDTAKTDVEYTYPSAVKIGNILTTRAMPNWGLFMARLKNLT